MERKNKKRSKHTHRAQNRTGDSEETNQKIKEKKNNERKEIIDGKDTMTLLNGTVEKLVENLKWKFLCHSV